MKKELKQYAEKATRTESLIDQVNLNPIFLLSVMAMAKASGNMLDQIKKHTFYGKEYNEDQLKEDFHVIVGGLEGVKHSLGELNDEQPLGVNPRIFHAILGMATESAELLEALDIMGGKMDNVNLLEECFDIDWYQFILLDTLDGDLQELWDTGFAKLKARFPDKFTCEDAVNRDLKTEREILNDLVKNPLDEQNLS